MTDARVSRTVAEVLSSGGGQARVSRTVAEVLSSGTAQARVSRDVVEVLWGFVPPTGFYPDAVLADAPLGYWRLDEPSGLNAYDSSGRFRNGVYFNGPTLGVRGALGDGNAAVGFDGTNDYVEIPATGMDADGDFTVEAWFKTSLAAKRQIVSRWANGNGALQRWSLQLDTSGRPTFVAQDTGYRTIAMTTGKADGAWHHLVVTASGLNLTMYLDGASVATGTRASTDLGGDTAVVRIGATADGGEFFNGSLDEVAIYGTALTASRVQAHYTAGRIAFHVIGSTGTVRVKSPSGSWQPLHGKGWRP